MTDDISRSQQWRLENVEASKAINKRSRRKGVLDRARVKYRESTAFAALVDYRLGVEKVRLQEEYHEIECRAQGLEPPDCEGCQQGKVADVRSYVVDQAADRSWFCAQCINDVRRLAREFAMNGRDDGP